MPPPARPRCYVASPLGFTESGRHYYSGVYLPALREVVDVVDPWTLVDDADVERAAREGRHREMALHLGATNIEAIRGCDLLCAHLDGQEVDSGTAAEVGFATGLGLPCFGVRTDLRQAGEHGMHVNLQVEALILASGGRVTASLHELVDALRAHLR